MAAEATGEARVIPRSGAGGLKPWQALSPAQPGHLPPDWQQEKSQKLNGLLKELGVSVHFPGPWRERGGGYLERMLRSHEDREQ